MHLPKPLRTPSTFTCSICTLNTIRSLSPTRQRSNQIKPLLVAPARPSPTAIGIRCVVWNEPHFQFLRTVDDELTKYRGANRCDSRPQARTGARCERLPPPPPPRDRTSRLGARMRESASAQYPSRK